METILRRQLFAYKGRTTGVGLSGAILRMANNLNNAYIATHGLGDFISPEPDIAEKEHASFVRLCGHIEESSDRRERDAQLDAEQAFDMTEIGAAI